jgi:CRP/FNR family transcriptional regulator, polysaccharide utilization system transcription regulator
MLPSYGLLTKEQVELINANSHLIKYKKGKTICQQGHPIFFVMFLKSGLAKIYYEFNGDRTSIIGITESQKYLCLMSLFDSQLFLTSVAALEDSEIIQTRLDVFMKILEENGKYAISILQQISRSGILLVKKMAHTSHKQVPGRLAEMLLLFSKEFYKNDTFELPMSRQEIADFISSTKETVSRTISEFKNDRIIEFNDRVITLKSIDLLDKLSKIG